MKKTASLLLLTVVLAACGPSPTAPPAADDGTPTRGGTVVVGLLSDVQSWNPYLVEDLDTELVLGLVYPSLMREMPDYQLHPPSFAPSLARSWTWSDNHLELTLELDPDARWSDGVPITARDVVFTWHVQTSPAIGWLYADAKDSIRAVTALGDHRVRVVYSRRHPYQLMDLNDGLIVPAHAWGEIPLGRWGEIDWSEQVVAGGPFQLVRHTPQQEIVLERNPARADDDRPYLDRVVARIIPSKQALMTQLLAGEVDFVRAIDPSAVERAMQDPGLELVIYDGRAYTHICWNTVRPPLDDPAIRRALTTAIDRQTIIDVVYDGFGRLGVGPVLSTFWAFNRELEPMPFDPAAAAAALAAAGWVDRDGDGVLDRAGVPFRIELLAPAENELRQDIAILVQTDLERIGIETELRFVEWGALMAAVSDGEFDALVNLWEEPTQIDLAGLWHSPPPGEATFNFGRYSNPEVDRLLADVARLTDPAEQKPLYDRIQELIVADQPYTFIMENTRITAHDSAIRGAEINAASPFFNIEQWSVSSVEGD